MKSSDKMLLGIVAGIVLLVVVALVLTLTEPPPEYLSDDTPGGIVHNYLLALQQEDYERAYGYLSRSLKCYPSSVNEFTVEVRSNSWSFGRSDDGSSWSVEDSDISGTRANVRVAEARFRERGLFESGQTFGDFDVDLALENAEWRIVDAERYWARWEWTANYCQ